jgi:NAD(P)-dependent dehydrogenase (short-subunit alcohol dehydrogenase family)
MEAPLTDQVALVTGGGQGIGRAIALRLARDGMHVIVADRNRATAESVAAEVEDMGRLSLALPVDVSIGSERERMIATTVELFGRLDALVNNAAIQRVSLPLDVSEEHWDAVMDINAKAVYFCAQLALRQMLSQGSGRVVNIASMAGKAGTTLYHPVYNVSKAAVISMTKTLALAVADKGLRVNAVCPGVVVTPMQDVVDSEFSRVTGKPPEQIRGERVARIPMGRVETPEEVADVVAFLIGPDSRYMTGQAINVTGGMITY